MERPHRDSKSSRVQRAFRCTLRTAQLVLRVIDTSGRLTFVTACRHTRAVTESPVLHRLMAVVVLLALAAASPAVTLCAGWASSAAERMACCERDSSGCTVSSDSCCAEGEAQQNVETPAALIPVREPAVSAAPGVIAPRRPVRAADPRSLAEPPAPYLLHSVFRI